MADAATLTRFRVDGMDCAGCANKIDSAVRRLPGVEDVSVSVTAGTMAIKHGPDVDLAAIERKVTGLGYQVAPLEAKMIETVVDAGSSERRAWLAGAWTIVSTGALHLGQASALRRAASGSHGAAAIGAGATGIDTCRISPRRSQSARRSHLNVGGRCADHHVLRADAGGARSVGLLHVVTHA